MVKQCTILFGCMALGELLVKITGISLPGSIIGMLLLAAFLDQTRMGQRDFRLFAEQPRFLLRSTRRSPHA